MWFMYKFQKLMLEGIDYIMNILLVCTGNTCRSSMAKGLLEQILDEEGDRSIEVDSAGLNVYVPSEASENAVEVMDEMGVDISGHRSRQLTKEDIEKADLVLVMTPSHRSTLIDLFPQYADKIDTLLEYAYGQDMAISDPFGLEKDAYQQCALQIRDALRVVYRKLKAQEGHA